MLINFSRYPLVQWSAHQKEEAIRIYGKIEEVAFPEVPVEADVAYIEDLAERCFIRISAVLEEYAAHQGEKLAVLVEGEPTLTFAVVRLLQKEEITCIVPAMERRVRQLPNGSTEVSYEFFRFREYPFL